MKNRNIVLFNRSGGRLPEVSPLFILSVQKSKLFGDGKVLISLEQKAERKSSDVIKGLQDE